MELIALKAFYAMGKWYKKGDVFKIIDCYSCIQKLIKDGKAKKHENI